MNIGKWIVVSFILFAAFIGVLVTVCLRQDISLVSNQYYKDELIYEDQLTRMSNTQALGEKPAIVKVHDSQLEVTFTHAVDKGKLRLFCPSDSRMDRDFELKLLDNKQSIDIGSLKSGMYRVKLYWSADAKDYFMEEIITI